MNEDFLDSTLKALRHPAATQRHEALRVLEQRGERDVLRFATYARRLNPAVCLELCRVLAHTSTAVLADVVGYYAAQPEPALRAEALRAMERMHGVVRVAALERLLPHEDPAVREAACQLLGLSGSQGPREGLVRALRDDVPNVVLAALEAVRVLRLSEAHAEVTALLNSAFAEVRTKALEVLVDFDPQRGFPAEPVVPLLESDPVPRVRLAAAWALGARPSAVGRTALLTALDRGTPEVQAGVAAALGQHRHPDVAQALTQTVVRGSETAVALQCERSLRALPEDLVRSACLTALEHGDPAARSRAAALMGELAFAGFAGPLIHHLKAETEPVARAALAEALGEGGWEEAWPVLRAAALEERAVALPAIKALGLLLKEDHVEDYCQLLDQLKDDLLVETVLARLSSYGKVRPLPESLAGRLRPLFNAPQSHTAELAIEAASWLKGAQLTAPLFETTAASGEDAVVRAAGRALLKLCDGHLSTLLERAAPKHLEAFAKVLKRQTSLGEEGPAVCRRLADLQTQGVPGAAHALLECAFVDPPALTRALKQAVGAGADPEAEVLLGVWGQLPETAHDGASVDWMAFLSSASARVRAATLRALGAGDAQGLLPVLVDIAVADSNAEVRSEAHLTVKRAVEAEQKAV